MFARYRLEVGTVHHMWYLCAKNVSVVATKFDLKRGKYQSRLSGEHFMQCHDEL